LAKTSAEEPGFLAILVELAAYMKTYSESSRWFYLTYRKLPQQSCPRKTPVGAPTSRNLGTSAFPSQTRKHCLLSYRKKNHSVSGRRIPCGKSRAFDEELDICEE
jgi:hypothetical protein